MYFLQHYDRGENDSALGSSRTLDKMEKYMAIITGVKEK